MGNNRGISFRTEDKIAMYWPKSQLKTVPDGRSKEVHRFHTVSDHQLVHHITANKYVKCCDHKCSSMEHPAL